MEIKAITQVDDAWTRVIDYAEGCSWKAGVNLAKAMKEEQFTEWERVFVATKDNEIAGYCTVAKKKGFLEINQRAFFHLACPNGHSARIQRLTPVRKETLPWQAAP